MNVFENAVIFALKAHCGQKRKDGNAFIIHPLEVATIVATMTNDQDVAAAAVLHDTVEDTDVTAEQILQNFGEKIAKLVASETEDKCVGQSKQSTWKKRKIESLKFLEQSDDINVKILWLSDKLANIRAFYREHAIEGDDFLKKFNQSDKGEQRWYFNEVSKLTECLSDTFAWQEFADLIKRVFD